MLRTQSGDYGDRAGDVSDYDFAIIGGGIVGLSTAMQLLDRYPDKSLVLLEKESQLAQHQTGHNSGVIHAGVYYEPGSFKAVFCRKGVAATLAFCKRHNIPFDQCGKLVVACTPDELVRLDTLYDRCLANGLNPERLDADGLRQAEPNITGLGAIRVASTGIVDYPGMCQAMAGVIRANGGEIRNNAEVSAIDESADLVTLQVNGTTLVAKKLIVCGGLQADRLAKMAGLDIDFRIVPFRGEYYRLDARLNGVVRHLIYPVPDPSLPFLGVHLTRMIDGSVTVGPNAVLGFSREGYAKGSVSLRDMANTFSYPGFWRLSAKHWRSGMGEMRNSLSKKGYLALCQKYCPSLTLDDLQPYPAGIRAQAVLKDGTMLHDFLIRETARTVHVCNAPSPAATSAIPIGEHIVAAVAKGNAS